MGSFEVLTSSYFPARHTYETILKSSLHRMQYAANSLMPTKTLLMQPTFCTLQNLLRYWVQWLLACMLVETLLYCHNTGYILDRRGRYRGLRGRKTPYMNAQCCKHSMVCLYGAQEKGEIGNLMIWPACAAVTTNSLKHLAANFPYWNGQHTAHSF